MDDFITLTAKRLNKRLHEIIKKTNPEVLPFLGDCSKEIERDMRRDQKKRIRKAEEHAKTHDMFAG